MSQITELAYTQIKHDTYGNPRYLVECPEHLTLEDVKKAGYTIATSNQTIYIHIANSNKSIPLIIKVKSYNITDTIASILKIKKN